MPVLHMVVLDLYYVRPTSKTDVLVDVNMQQEVIAATLLRYINWPKVGCTNVMLQCCIKH